MEITTHQHNQITVVSIVGSIDTTTAEDVSTYLKNQIKQGNINLVAELSQVDYLSSAGLRVLLGTAKETRRSGGDLRLASVEQHILDILNMAGFTSILKYYATESEAVASFAES